MRFSTTFERLTNTFLRRDVVDLLPEQVEVCTDPPPAALLQKRRRHNALYHSETRHGTIAFHAYATLYARVKNKQHTLAVHRLGDGEIASSALDEFPESDRWR